MTEGELFSTILDGAERLAALSKPQQKRTLIELEARATRVGVGCGLSEAAARTLAQELVDVLRMTASDSRSTHVFH